jgi:hypothetical protein
MSLILDGSNGLSDVDGTAATPAIRGTDANTGIFFPAADTIAFSEGGAEAMRINGSGNVLVGTTTATYGAANRGLIEINGSTDSVYALKAGGTGVGYIQGVSTAVNFNTGSAIPLTLGTNNSERMRIDSSGNVFVAKNSSSTGTVGTELQANGLAIFTRDGDQVLLVNRLTNDGTLVSFRQASIEEGTISVSGSTVSYNGGHLSRWSQLPNGSKDDTILKGTVMSNLDDMCVWEKDGVAADNEQLNKMKVSDVEGDTNVAGVFVNWTRDEDCNSDDMNVAMTGDMIIRIADGVVVQKGDLLMSAGDGTAKPQGDDIVRSKTIAKVTSNYVTCTYADGSYCVPCVLMAC